MKEKKQRQHKKLSKQKFHNADKRHNSMHQADRGSPRKIILERNEFYPGQNKNKNYDNDFELKKKASLEKELYKMLQES